MRQITEIVESAMRHMESGGEEPQRPLSRLFRQFSGECKTHGRYPLNTMSDDGIERWMPAHCPACQRQAAVDSLIRGAQIPERHKACSFENYDTSENEGQITALQACQSYAEKFAEHLADGRCLLLLGNRGNGKNHLATAIAKRLLVDGYSVLRVKATEFLDEYWARPFGERREWLGKLACVDFLILDEVGRHSAGVASHNAIFSLLDARSEAVKPTALLSSKSRAEIEEIVTLDGFDRLCENGGIMVRFCWESHRRGRRGAA